MSVDELLDVDTGRWQISTRTSIDLFDLDRRRVMRVPPTADEHGVDPSTGIIYVVRGMPGDFRPQPLARLTAWRRGEPMSRLVNIGGDLVAALTSTPVREIRRLSSVPQR